MAEQVEQKEMPLSEKKVDEIWFAICSHMQADDRDPNEVIKDTFGGDRDAYLRAMAPAFGISLEE